MKIGLDISQIVYQGTGVARFTQGLVDTILKYDQKNHWIFFFSGLRQKLPHKYENEIKKKNHQLIELPLPPTLLSIFFNKFKIKIRERSSRIGESNPIFRKTQI